MTPSEIRQLRNALHMTQAQFAQLLGVHSLTVSKWERGLLEPSPYHVALMRSFLKATQRSPDVGTFVAGLLIGAGVGAALYHLLRAAFENDEG